MANFKVELNNTCQKNNWVSPIYSHVQTGSGHRPRFLASVEVHGLSFESDTYFGNKKDAYHDVAEKAFNHFADLAPACTTAPVPSPMVDISPAEIHSMLSSLMASHVERTRVEAERRELEDTRHRQLVESHARIEATVNQLLALYLGAGPSTSPSTTIDPVRDEESTPLVETPSPDDVPMPRWQ